MNIDLPSITIVIPTFNEEQNIGRCLNAILSQDYPKELIEIIVVDNGSTDRTLEIISEYMRKNNNIRLLFNNIALDAEISKMIGLRNANGELYMYLDADIEVVGEDWLKKLTKPLIERSDIVGSFPRFIPKPDDKAIGRYLRYHPLELDPIFQFFCTKIEETIIEEKDQYKICEFHPPKIPPIGICLYRTEILRKVIGNANKFMDIDVPVILTKNGYNKFAYVPTCGMYHTNIRNLRDLIRKRLRNIDKVFLPNYEKREYKYFDIESSKGILKIILWIIYVHLFFPQFFISIYKVFKFRDTALLYEAIVAIIITDVIIYGFLRNKKGRKLILKALRRLFKVE